MDITSLNFYLFTCICLLVYWHLSAGEKQWWLLLVASIAFYCFNAHPVTILYLIGSIVSVYFATRCFKTFKNRKQCILILAIVFNVVLLAVLKYTNLAVHTWNILFAGQGVSLEEVYFLEPLAISFYTLQMLAYLLDCYWEVTIPESNIFKLALYASYFPQMVSGPISRHRELGSQLFERYPMDYGRVVHGLKRIAWGLLKKLAVSNRAAVVVNALWADPEKFSGFYIWIAVAGFVIQLYTDFSGCMDIVLGVSECFGICLAENFRAPLLSKTVQEFWQRWHITLGSWLRDYIMNPLAKSGMMVKLGEWSRKKFGKKKGRHLPVYLSMLVVWLCMGLWHGNSWKYILGEGLWFWLAIVCGRTMQKPFERWKRKLHIKEETWLWSVFQIVRTYVIFMVGSLFFRAVSFRDALHRIALSTRVRLDLSTFKDFAHVCISADLGGKSGLAVAALSFLLVAWVDICIYSGKKEAFQFFERHKVIRWVGYYVLVILLTLSLNIGAQEFLYAQF